MLLNRRRLLELGAATLAGGQLSGCRSERGKGGEGAHVKRALASQAGPPVRGGTLVFSDTEQVPSVQNQRLGSYSSYCLTFPTNVFLLYYDPRERSFQSWVAERWGKNPENTEYWFKIRKGITFSDGTPLTPQVVAKNYERFGRGDEQRRVPVHPWISRGFDHVEVDGDTVKIVLARPNQQFLRDVTRIQSGIIAEKTLELDFEEASQPIKHVGAGPFVYEAWVPGQEARLVRRRGYRWAPPCSPNQGEAYLDRLIWRVLPEVGLRTGALLSHQVDMARGIQPADEARIVADGYQLFAPRPPLGTSNYFALRLENEFTKDLRVRRALMFGVDHEGLNRHALTPSYPPPLSILNVDNRNAVDLRSEFKYDPDKSRDLLEQAGWKRAPDGIRQRSGRKLQLTVPQTPQQVALGPAWEYISQKWRKELGIALDVRTDPSFNLTARRDVNVPIVLGRTPIASLGQLVGGPNDTALLASPPELLALYQRELEAKDDAEFRQVQIEQQQALQKGAYVVPYFEEAQIYAASPNVHITFHAMEFPDFYNAWKSG